MQASYCNSKRTAVSVPGSGSNGLGSSPGRGHCVVLLVLFWIGYGGVGEGGWKRWSHGPLDDANSYQSAIVFIGHIYCA